MTLKVVFLDRDTLSPNVSLRAPCFAHEWQNYGSTPKELVVERLHECDIVVVNKVGLEEEQLRCLPKLKMIAVAATGTDTIDLNYCMQQDITVTNVRNYAIHSVPEHVMSLILALRRNSLSYHQDVINGEWQRSKQFCFFNHTIGDLAGSRLGIIGGGVLGRSMAKLGRAFGMDVTIANRKNDQQCDENLTPFDTVLTTSDIISLHCPLTADTKDLLTLKEFKQMKRSALLINTARGGIVNEKDLVIALRNGLIAGAGFDVLTQEPPSNDHPLLGLTDMPNFILTPHVAWASLQAMQKLADQLITNIEKFVKSDF